ncbi:MAG: hypothetical protein J0M24_18270 [Verrucomicrobia bacterium]|nr:hypothetical protein [Verrucomicrobiota bacterium]
MASSVQSCPPAKLAADCSATSCRGGCALEVIDELLARTDSVRGEDADLLLDLRSWIRRREDAEAVLRTFCELRRRLEHREYLAFFRLRRWLENHLIAEVRVCPAAEPRPVPVRLQYFCLEAIRRASLCSALGSGEPLLAPRVQFVYRTQPSSDEPSISSRSVSAVG